MKTSSGKSPAMTPKGVGKTGAQQPGYKGNNAKMSKGSSGTVAKNPGKR